MLKVLGVDDLMTILVEPWVDYIPVKMDMSDLDEKIKWAKMHDKNVRNIAISGRLKVEKKFSYKMLQCYTIKLLM